MEIKQFNNGKKGRFYIEIDGTEEAEITYTYAGKDKIIIDHTEVSDKLKGQSIGYKLINAAVDFARANNIKIKPLCTYVAAVFKKKKDEYLDIIH